MLAILLYALLGTTPARAENPGDPCFEGTQAESCFGAYGNGTQACEQGVSGQWAWGSCVLTSCTIGYHFNGPRTSCIADTASVDEPAAPPLPNLNVSLSTASALATAAEAEFKADSAAAAAKAEGSQKKSLEASHTVFAKGADRSASIGAIFCAEGALTAEKQPDRSASDFAACREHFRSAEDLNALAKRTGYDPDPGVLGTEAAKGMLAAFEKKIGLEEGEGASKLLGTKGARDALTDLLGSKFGVDRLAALLDAAPQGNAKAASSSGVTEGASSGRGGGGVDKLRDRLRKDLSARAVPGTDTKREKPIAVGELHAEDFFGKVEPAELTIFQVVHARYQELTRTQNLLWAR